MKTVRYKIGGRELLDFNVVSDGDLNCLNAYDPQLTYGKAKPKPLPDFVPNFVKLDKKVV